MQIWDNSARPTHCCQLATSKSPLPTHTTKSLQDNSTQPTRCGQLEGELGGQGTQQWQLRASHWRENPASEQVGRVQSSSSDGQGLPIFTDTLLTPSPLLLHQALSCLEFEPFGSVCVVGGMERQHQQLGGFHLCPPPAVAMLKSWSSVQQWYGGRDAPHFRCLPAACPAHHQPKHGCC